MLLWVCQVVTAFLRKEPLRVPSRMYQSGSVKENVEP